MTDVTFIMVNEDGTVAIKNKLLAAMMKWPIDNINSLAGCGL